MLRRGVRERTTSETGAKLENMSYEHQAKNNANARGCGDEGTGSHGLDLGREKEGAQGWTAWRRGNGKKNYMPEIYYGKGKKGLINDMG